MKPLNMFMFEVLSFKLNYWHRVYLEAQILTSQLSPAFMPINILEKIHTVKYIIFFNLAGSEYAYVTFI